MKRRGGRAGTRSGARPAAGANPVSEDRGLGYVAELLRLGQRAQLLQALVLDLADALAGDLEGAADLVERARLLTVQAVAKLEHSPLAIAERAEALRERGRAERRVGSLVGERCRLVLDELAELRLF